MFPDVDGDGYGDRSAPVRSCNTREPDYVRDGSDCDDAVFSDNPDAPADTCNGVDDDCDGVTDETCACTSASYGGHDYLFCTTALDWATARGYCEQRGMALATIDDAGENAFVDATADAESGGTWYLGLTDQRVEGLFRWQFAAPSGYDAFDVGEPDDNPGAADCAVLNAPGAAAGTWADEDCTSPRAFVCEEIAGCTPVLWYPDPDGDGYGDSAAAFGACSAPPDYIGAGGDCVEGNATIYPGADEVVADGVDQDCDGGDRCYLDADEDGSGIDAFVDSADLDCDDPGEAVTTDDCDDGAATTYPGAPEICGDGADNDCDGAGGPDTDDDGDGLAWEVEAPVGGDDCNVDTDDDGLDDAFEYPLGTATPTACTIWPTPTTTTTRSAPGRRAPARARSKTAATTRTTGSPTTSTTTPTATGSATSRRPCSTRTPTACRTSSTARTTARRIWTATACSSATRRPSASTRCCPTPTATASTTASRSPTPAPPPTPTQTAFTDGIDPDDDGDGVLTANEDVDGDGDPRNDDTDADATPDYLDDDDDGDGVLTANEDVDGDGDPRNDDTDADGRPDYLDPADWDGPAGDMDGDGLSNGLEDAIGSDPNDFDSDSDGLMDGEEIGSVDAPRDSDGDGQIDVLDPDDDGDGIDTLAEGSNDLDGDGVPNHLDRDADGDGIEDGEEGFADRDCDGVFDLFDPDPTDRCADAPDRRGVYTPGSGLSCASSGTSPSAAASTGAWAVLAALAARRRSP